ncbi:MAG: succinoglycan biosynthesis protein exop [Mesorhizobium sp.]|nr:succinoglycan biosynthesis protein exop [Mesorhizobium sp.]
MTRHSRARARRERRANPVLSAPIEPEVDAVDEPLVHEQPEPHRLRDLISGHLAEDDRGTTESPMESEPLGGDVTGKTVSEPLNADGAVSPTERRTGGGMSMRPVIGLTLAGAAIGAAVAFAWPKSYVATSELLIDPQALRAGVVSGQLSADTAFALVDNQLRVLRSGTMLEAAADRLNLAADPEFNGDAAGPFGLGGALAGFSDLVAGDGSSTVERRRTQSLQALARAVEVNRQGGSSVIAVSAETGDPEKSALIANTISELFLANSSGAGSASGSMGQRLAELRAGVEDAERAIADFRAKNGLVDAQGRLISDDEILRLSERLSAAQARTVELNARAASTREANVDSIVTGSLPEQYASSTLTDLRSRYAAARQQVDRLGVKLGPRHPELLSSRAELEGTRQEIADELRRVAAALQTELRRAVREEQELSSQLAEMKARQGDIGGELVALRELEREASAKRSVYEQSLQAAQAGPGASAAGGASLISRAVPPLYASGPSMPAFSLAGALTGLLAGLGVVGVRRRRQDDDEGWEAPATEQLETELPIITQSPQENQDAGTRPEGRRDGEETDEMHSYDPYRAYPHNVDPAAAQPAYASTPPHQHGMPYGGQQPAQQPAHAHPYAHQPVPPAPPGWPQMPAAAAYQPQPHHMPMAGWPAHYPAPQQHYYPQAGAYAPSQQPQFGAPAYAPPQHYAYPPNHEVPPRSFDQPRQAAPEQAFDQNAYIDESTDAAIEEIRQSLREFRDAIEDFAHSRAPRKRYGT